MWPLVQLSGPALWAEVDQSCSKVPLRLHPTIILGVSSLSANVCLFDVQHGGVSTIHQIVTWCFVCVCVCVHVDACSALHWKCSE